MLVEKNMANLSSDRFQGGMRAMGGFVEGSVGAGLFATPSFGAGQFVGGLMIVHGYDNFQSGLWQAYSGSYQEPATIPFLKGFGFSHETAHLAHEGFGIFSTVGGGMQLGIQRAASLSISRLPTQNAQIGSQINLLGRYKNATQSGSSTVSTGRNRLMPNLDATGAHTVFRRDPLLKKVTHYETFRPQTNPFDPKPWESVVRFDGIGKGHTNKILQQLIETPHVHDPSYPGGVRAPYVWEIPGG